ncbi:hypothetical protein AB9N12_18040 [Bacteroides sp. AN502(2024)]|uniref:hypothetical protein n=1 Tax=Bacteroides sp. AN502(2024) TaxID=3160599 RepID=UPI0035131C9D
MNKIKKGMGSLVLLFSNTTHPFADIGNRGKHVLTLIKNNDMNPLKVWLILAATVIFICCGRKNNSVTEESVNVTKHNSIYHWKTVFDIDSIETSFLRKHNIKRIYVRMFDVATEQNYQTGSVDIVPIATTKFLSAVPDSLEIIPVTYITIDALRAMGGRETEFASLITERLLAMSSYNECGEIREIQLDCDWTESTKDSYSRLCQTIKDSLHPKNIELSITVRLHQLQEMPPTADGGVLMLYNTGALQNPNTKNSILDIADVRPYIKPIKYPIPLDFAYPFFGWGVKFENNKFVSIVSADSATSSGDRHIRYERPTPSEIFHVKGLIEQNLGKPHRGNILYHLDEKQLKNYTDDEIDRILSL